MPPPAKRRKNVPTVEEIPFDPQARQEYLTGFHKRKLQRIKHSQEAAAKKEKEEKLEERRKLRESRKEEAANHVEAVNSILRRAEGMDAGTDGSASDSEVWNGFQDTLGNTSINHEDEYTDEDRHTTVVVETIDVSKDGLQPTNDQSSSAEGDDDDAITHKVDSTGSVKQGKDSASNPKRVWTKEKPKKLKSKKFRYESKADRKTTRAKERSGSKAKAKARRE
ncbi:MAG: hypothetical protein M1837_001281 [Sclerophora amabilis]|nr:MAG: hypothetical protein M1837_001281 [Sclerophora amabilis]